MSVYQTWYRLRVQMENLTQMATRKTHASNFCSATIYIDAEQLMALVYDISFKNYTLNPLNPLDKEVVPASSV